ncbi:hypothetical protein BURPS406E_H1204 [Burkholderia pseudomallei 406e]|uniref:Uncharacterized protein n=1 Tax=Burkholderia pseudomallei 1710a TaxID=320371 RepID=A0A0E1W361_BURPE|nr:hypothetical protein BURPS406E_H1204 [Burkholderia pseudomallei 406e]EDO91972.1 hypothetical protein BURPSPAST_AA0421 [Burkholderia pseudomallei Pasteur 52237]EET07655.1 hypothetical protein BURPS1710A_2220 [Burkholderia pseudomallei 1710a]
MTLARPARTPPCPFAHRGPSPDGPRAFAFFQFPAAPRRFD